ncbi:hypothetical protein A6F65_01800 [Paraurantiacibacter namhicola]|uniref:Uncharacterized protein n=1 Tax=Paraurantiacibacter namhicola TaxID=645517 RepID=A0A1C7D9I5_9SPHN|nr:hypothetical protein A6F65_01800 [Paraurantiacibacter namhicola]
MNFLVLLGSAATLLVVLLTLQKFAPFFLDRLGGGSDAGGSSAAGGSYGEGGCGGGGD